MKIGTNTRRPARVRRLVGSAIIAGALLASPSDALANTFKPTRFDDPNPMVSPAGQCKPNNCSLRGAVVAANKHGGPDTIVLKPGHYELTFGGVNENNSLTGDLDVKGNLTVEKGAGSGAAIVDGFGLDRIFDVRGPTLNLAVRNLTLENGYLLSDPGGAIYDAFGGTGGVLVAGCHVIKNTGRGGGGIYSASPLHITNSTVRKNYGLVGTGGGVFTTALVAQHSRFIDNQNSPGGAGAYVEGPVTVTSSTFSGNQTDPGSGGGGLNATMNGAKVEISNSEFLGNTGAGSVSTNGPTKVTGSTFSGNMGSGIIANGRLQISASEFLANRGVEGVGAFANHSTEISGSTFSGNIGTGLSPGAGLYVAGRTQISDSRFTANKTGGFGGGAYLLGKTTVTDSQFDRNVTRSNSAQGGALYTSGPTTITRSTFTANRNNGNGEGAGLYASKTGAETRISRSVFHANKAGESFGGAYTDGPTVIGRSTFSANNVNGFGGGGAGLYANQPGATVQISRSKFVGNQAGYNAGVYTNGPTTVGGSTFRGNVANGLFAGGGGLNANQPGARVEIANTKFLDNEAFSAAGASTNGFTKIDSSTFEGNVAGSGFGGGILINARARISASRFTGNKATQNGGGAYLYHQATVEGSTFHGNVARDGYSGGGLYTNGAIVVSGSSFTANRATGTGSGGGLYAAGAGANTEISRSVFAGNKSGVGGSGVDGVGGGAYTAGPTTVRRSRFTGNVAGAGGGGLEAAGASVDVSRTVFHKNTAGANGGDSGGGLIANGAATISKSSFSANKALVSGGGGGLILEGSPSTIRGTTVNGNLAAVGGGIYNSNGQTATIVDSTVSGNSAYGGGGGVVNQGTMSFNDVTVAGNVADKAAAIAPGGGVFNGSGSSFAVQNSIIAGNSLQNAGGSATGPDCGGSAFTSGGHNLVQKSAGCTGFTASGDIIHKSAKLGALADNGGPTLTRALLSGSPAIDGGSPSTPGSGGNACAKRDQRGVTRPLGKRCDIGALEQR
jgi:hypothetical protein